MLFKKIITIVLIEIFLLSQVLFNIPVNINKHESLDIVYRVVRSAPAVLPDIDILWNKEHPYSFNRDSSVSSEKFQIEIENLFREQGKDLGPNSIWSDLSGHLAAMFDYYDIEKSKIDGLITETLSVIENLKLEIEELSGSSEGIYLMPWIGLIIEASVKEGLNIIEAGEYVKDRIKIAKWPEIQNNVSKSMGEDINFSDFDDVSYLFSAADSLVVSAHIFDTIDNHVVEDNLDAFANLTKALIGIRNKYNISEAYLLDVLSQVITNVEDIVPYIAAVQDKSSLDIAKFDDLATVVPWISFLIEDIVSNDFTYEEAKERLKEVLKYSSYDSVRDKVKETLGVSSFDYTHFDQMRYLSMPARLELLKDRIGDLVVEEFGYSDLIAPKWMDMAGDMGEVMLAYGKSETEVVSRMYSLLNRTTEIVEHLPGYDGENFSFNSPEDIRHLTPWIALGVEEGVKNTLSTEAVLDKLFSAMGKAGNKKISSYAEASELASKRELSRLNKIKEQVLSIVKNPLAKPFIYTALGLGLTQLFTPLMGDIGVQAQHIPAYLGYGYVFGKMASAAGTAIKDFVAGRRDNLSYNMYNLLNKTFLAAITSLYSIGMEYSWEDAPALTNLLFLPYIYINSHIARLAARSVFKFAGYGKSLEDQAEKVKFDPNIISNIEEARNGELSLANHGGTLITVKNSSGEEVMVSMDTIEKSFRNNLPLDENGNPSLSAQDNFKMFVVSGTTNRKVLKMEIGKILELQEKYGKDRIIYVQTDVGKKFDNYQALFQFLQEGITHNVSFTSDEYDERYRREFEVNGEMDSYIQLGGTRVGGSDYYLEEIRRLVTSNGAFNIENTESRTYLVNFDNPSEKLEMYMGDLYRLDAQGNRGERILAKEEYIVSNGVIKDRESGKRLQGMGLPFRVFKEIEQKIYYKDSNGESRYLTVDKKGNLFDEQGELFALERTYSVNKFTNIFKKFGRTGELEILPAGNNVSTAYTFALQEKTDTQSIREGKIKEGEIRYSRFVLYDQNGNEKILLNEGDLVDENYNPVVIDGMPLRRGEFRISDNKLIVKRLTTTEYEIDEDSNLINPRNGAVIFTGVRKVNENTLIGAAKSYLENFTRNNKNSAVIIDEANKKRLAFDEYNLTLYRNGNLVPAECEKGKVSTTEGEGFFFIDSQGRLLKDGGKYVRGHFIGRSGQRFVLDELFTGMTQSLLRDFALTPEENREIVRTGILGDVESLHVGRTGNESHYFVKTLPEEIRNREDVIFYRAKTFLDGFVISEADGFYRDKNGDIYWRNLQGEDVLISKEGNYFVAHKYVAQLNQDTGERESYTVLAKRNAFFEKDGNYYERKILGMYEDAYFDDTGNAISREDDTILAEAGTFVLDEDGYLRAKNEGNNKIVGTNFTIDDKGQLIKVAESHQISDDDGEFLIVGDDLVRKENGELFEIPHRVEYLAQTDAENIYNEGSAKLLISMLSYLKQHGDKYSMLQPEMRITNPGESSFAKIISWAHRMVLYGERVFSDVAGKSPAFGKMVFNLEKYLSDVVTQEVIPWETDSHDTLEAMWGGSQLVASNSPLLTEESPSTYLLGKIIAQRWVRGDLKNIATNHPFFKSISALLKGEFDELNNISLDPKSDEMISSILYNLLGPTLFAMWLGIGLYGAELGVPVLPQVAFGLFAGVMTVVAGIPNIVMPIYEKAVEGRYNGTVLAEAGTYVKDENGDILSRENNTLIAEAGTFIEGKDGNIVSKEDYSGYAELLGKGTLQALVSTSVYLMNLVYLPVAIGETVWNQLRGKPGNWTPTATVKRMLERAPSLKDTYKELWLAPTVGAGLALMAGLTGNTSLLAWGSPIWFGSFILGPLATWFTGTKGQARDFTRKIIEAIRGE